MPLKKKTKKVEAKKPAKKEVKKPVKKEAKKAPKKTVKVKTKKQVKVVAKKTKKKVTVFTPVKEKESKRVYHIAKRPDGKWAVKFAGGEKAIKLFDTQAEAKAYSEKMAQNQDGVVLIHNSKGKNKGRIQ